jgi:hypothetical protein
MDHSLKKADLQKLLFDEAGKRLPPRHSLVDVISDLLEISSDAAYRRIRCDKIMDIGEVALLCAHFGISLDALLNIPAVGSGGAYFYSPMNLDDIDNYYIYMQNIAAKLDGLRVAQNAEIVSSALDVPFFHFLPFKELTFFKLFAWTNSVYPTSEKFEAFASKVESKELLDCYKKIVTGYRSIPSKEIWTKDTTDAFMKLIGYHFEMGHFSDIETPLSLCDQFLDLLNTLENWTGDGNKGEVGYVPFQLYLSDVEMENSFNLLKEDDRTSCILKLFTINSLYVTDKQFCSETENWLTHLSRRATLISGSSERERHKFFNSQRQKVGFLIDTISNSMTI